MNILVTGGAGFIGSNFIIYWLKKHPQDRIVNLDALTYAGNPENLTSVDQLPNYRFVKGNICNAKLVSQLCKGIDIVVHFAAESHVDRSIKDPGVFLETNVSGTHILLKSALKNKIKRFHHISTDEVFGSLDLSENKKFNENTPYFPRSPYAASKAASDHLVLAFYHTYGLPVTITNCSNNYGPYQHPEKLIPLTITNIIENKKVPVYGDGKNIRDWLYVEDHCRAIDLVLKEGKIGETYCIGGLLKDVSNLEIIRMIFRILKKEDSLISFVKDRPGHDRKYAIDWSKIKKDLGWQPEATLEEWLTKTVEWYSKNRVWWQKLKKGQFEIYFKQQYPDL
ncbi:dTDP-glucose 4,6-dehydratase [Candidatus Gottesmanbacteria bacterium RBG_16_37_8]|uniref:dTDP-glucose 4,6-dehydratase n=1 Tax=Candidatus Gottesmanbacteria bacterium RBG_16_37_8 TaxID=1798371 RepID=A0A1F5YQC2_9BACT|nr:MAG: dTDP-glucose 4,6-dehydratase [Candidatus Gottesmanbacteria bacterium RBG_16_37_8]